MSGLQAGAVGEGFRAAVEDVDEAPAPGSEPGFGVGLQRQVAAFVGVFVQVEEVFAAGLGVPDVLLVAVGNEVVAVVVSVAAGVLAVKQVPDTVGFAAHDGEEAVAGAGGWWIYDEMVNEVYRRTREQVDEPKCWLRGPSTPAELIKRHGKWGGVAPLERLAEGRGAVRRRFLGVPRQRHCRAE